MIFHKKAQTSHSFAPSDEPERTEPNYRLAFLNAIIALLFVISLIVAAFYARSKQWDEGATMLLHLAELVVGGSAGLFLGERSTLNIIQKA